MSRKIAWGLAFAALLITGVLGIYNGPTEWGSGLTLFQKSVTGGVFLYGVVGLVAAFGLLRRRRWSVIAASIWGVIVTYVPGAAVKAYAEEGATWKSAIAASAASAVIACLVVWAAWINTRGGVKST